MGYNIVIITIIIYKLYVQWCMIGCSF